MPRLALRVPFVRDNTSSKINNLPLMKLFKPKFTTMLLAFIVAVLIAPPGADAQLLKKLSKRLEKVNKTLEQVNEGIDKLTKGLPLESNSSSETNSTSETDDKKESAEFLLPILLTFLTGRDSTAAAALPCQK